MKEKRPIRLGIPINGYTVERLLFLGERDCRALNIGTQVMANECKVAQRPVPSLGLEGARIVVET